MSSDKLPIKVGDLIRDGEQVLIVVKEHAGCGECMVKDSATDEQFLLDRLAAYAMIIANEENKC